MFEISAWNFFLRDIRFSYLPAAGLKIAQFNNLQAPSAFEMVIRSNVKI